MEAYLNVCRVLIKDSGTFAQGLAARLKAAAYARAAAYPPAGGKAAPSSRWAFGQARKMKTYIQEGGLYSVPLKIRATGFAGNP